ncbi:MAG: hypothetical protein AAF376_12685 [Pseudomonadota bacterium]
MKNVCVWPILSMALLAGCVPATPEGEVVELSPEVLALAAPGQNIPTARIESDGCYWVLHQGPVETTYIPLLTPDSRMICTRPQS